MSLVVNLEWDVTTSLHVGSGLSQAGKADSLVRTRHDRAEVPGEAFKGAVRGSAERIGRWMIGGYLGAEGETASKPTHPVLRRLFDCTGEGPRYTFFGARESTPSVEPQLRWSTAIQEAAGTAKANSLRITEAHLPGRKFSLQVEGGGGRWDQKEHRDYLDLLFLLVALISVEQVGGKKGIGWGQVRLVKIETGIGIDPAIVASPAMLETIKDHLRTEAALDPKHN